MKVSELTGSLLDFWVARTQEIAMPEPGSFDHKNLNVYVYTDLVDESGNFDFQKYSPSSVWAHGGPLIEKYGFDVSLDEVRQKWDAMSGYMDYPSEGDTPLQAICRAVVRAEFGDDL